MPPPCARYKLLVHAAERRNELAPVALPSASRGSTERIPHLHTAEDLLHCGISIEPMSPWGHERRIGPDCNTFALPPGADIEADIVEPPLRAKTDREQMQQTA